MVSGSGNTAGVCWEEDLVYLWTLWGLLGVGGGGGGWWEGGGVV